MFFDFNEAWNRATEVDYDVCICGTGPAGTTVARTLAAAGKKVLLLEAGGLSYSDQSQDIYKGKNTGRDYWDVDVGRLRYFGGTSNHWTGRCGLLDPIDFQERDYHDLPGWPISRDEVLGDLDEASKVLDISVSQLMPVAVSEFGSLWFAQDAYALSPPTRFAEKYGNEIRQSNKIDAFYNANLIDLTLDSDLTQVSSLLVRNYAGKETRVSAKQYVLALGAIENARILLNANKQLPQGIGNHSGLVGRCFMEHLNVPIGRFIVTDPDFWQRHPGIPLAATEQLLRRSHIGNGIVAFNASATPRSYGRLRVLKQFLRETGCVSSALTETVRHIIDFDCPGDGIVSSLIEQSPNINSRVELAHDVDAFGSRRIQLNWQLQGRDLRTIRVLAVEAAKEMARLNYARVQLAPFILDTKLDIEVGGHSHHMGTTRMSADRRHGVVDQNCQVHDSRNLFVIGSSVFPTSGGTNPTLTIVLLALRLSRYLSNRA
jgi:choline dehydrogenase-like flavoprotein